MKNEKRMSDRETRVTIFALYLALFMIYSFLATSHRVDGFILECGMDVRVVMVSIAVIFASMSTYKIVKYRAK